MRREFFIVTLQSHPNPFLPSRVNVCVEDWLEMYVVYRDRGDRLLGRYCGLSAPGPVESPRGALGIRIFLHTDDENVASGFRARYIFEVAKSVFGDCGGNYSGQESGLITSPNYPANYHGPGKGLASRACNWYITPRTGYKILLNFDVFSVEGSPPDRGCPAAVLRIWMSSDSDDAPQEICGEKSATENWPAVSQGAGTVRISFTTTDKTIGAQVSEEEGNVKWTAGETELLFSRDSKSSGRRCRTLGNGWWRTWTRANVNPLIITCAR